jgi:hypothetical protein
LTDRRAKSPTLARVMLSACLPDHHRAEMADVT